MQRTRRLFWGCPNWKVIRRFVTVLSVRINDSVKELTLMFGSFYPKSIFQDLINNVIRTLVNELKEENIQYEYYKKA